MYIYIYCARVQTTCNGYSPCSMLVVSLFHTGHLEAFMDTMDDPVHSHPDKLDDDIDPAGAEAEDDGGIENLFDSEEIADLDAAGKHHQADMFDESELVTMMGTYDGKTKAPPSFFERPVYKELSEKGLTRIPDVEHCGISCHTVSQQWHARWGNENYAPTWGENTRSEQKALLLCLMRLWTRYLEIVEDEEAKAYLKELAAYNKTVSF